MNNQTCGCCEGIEKLTPQNISNRPGLKALAYRVGTHASFLETMLARLSDLFLEITESSDSNKKNPVYPLRGLKTRDRNDPAIAWLDSWATIADVLTFYQERIANEGFLRTAIERRSILELARLVGYKLRPGVAATVYLAFDLEKNQHVEIPKGVRAQSIPGPGEMPQAFETSQPLEARFEWNALAPRISRPQFITLNNISGIDNVYFKGINTNLKSNDLLMFIFGYGIDKQLIYFIDTVEITADGKNTKVVIQKSPVFELVSAVTLVISKYSDWVMFSINPNEPIVNEVLGALKQILDLESTSTSLFLNLCSIFQQVQRKNLILSKSAQSQLKNWLGKLLTDLENILRQFNPTFSDFVNEVISDINVQLQIIQSLNLNSQANDNIKLSATSNLNDLKNGLSVFFSYTQFVVLLNNSLQKLKADSDQAVKFGEVKLNQTIKEIIQKLNKIKSCLDFKIFSPFLKLQELIPPLLQPPSLQPINPLRCPHSISRSFSNKSDIGPQLLVVQNPELESVIYKAWNDSTVSATSELKDVVTFRVKAAPFGHNAPQQANIPANGGLVTYTEWKIPVKNPPNTLLLYLDREYKEIKPNSWIIIEHARFPKEQKKLRVESVQTVTRTDYSISAKVTQITIKSDWYNINWLEYFPKDTENYTISLFREVTIYAQSESFALAEILIEEEIFGDSIELNGLYDGLQSGRWLVVAGERTDLTAGSQSDKVHASEVVMLTGVTQDANPDLPGDTPHTTLHFANSLAYRYKRDTVTINANVAHATQGETRSQILGSGNGSKALQEFKLSFTPLTYIPALASSGIESTLEVRVNNVLWREVDNFSELELKDRRYITRQDNAGNTFVIFGDGEHGARLPTGVENVKAVYRNGLGKAGNVAAEQISLLATRPLGVKGVLNPQPATGGADPEDANSGRYNTTIALQALDRAVSVQDYANFARAFAGIGKASAKRLSDGRRDLVHLTITGADDIPISKNSDLYRNLQQALYRFGDPHQALQIDMRDLLLMVISARVKIFPEFLWEAVEPRIRTAILEAFGFHNRELGQCAFRSELISTIEAVEGVDFVDVDRFDALSQTTIIENLALLDGSIKSDVDRIPVELAKVDPAAIDPDPRIKPAQLAYLSPKEPRTLNLTELT